MVGSKCDIPVIWKCISWQAGSCFSLVAKSAALVKVYHLASDAQNDAVIWHLSLSPANSTLIDSFCSMVHFDPGTILILA